MIQDLVLYISCMAFLIVIFLGIIYVEWYLPHERRGNEKNSIKPIKPVSK